MNNNIAYGAKVYISGKINGLSRTEVEEKFARSEELLRAKGYVPVSPLSNGVKEGSKWEEYLAVDLMTILDCSAVFLQNDWRDSPGARLEFEFAKVAKKKIFEIENGELIKKTYLK